MKDDLIWYAVTGENQMNIRLREQWIGILVRNQVRNSENFQKWEYTVDTTLLDPTRTVHPQSEDTLPEHMQILAIGKDQSQVLQEGQRIAEKYLRETLARAEKEALFSDDKPYQEHASTLPDEVATVIQELGTRPIDQKRIILDVLEVLPLDLRYTALQRYVELAEVLKGNLEQDEGIK